VIEEEAWDRSMAINLKSALFLRKHAIPRMVAGGAIVNVSSTAVEKQSASVVYSASKGALEALTKSRFTSATRWTVRASRRSRTSSVSVESTRIGSGGRSSRPIMMRPYPAPASFFGPVFKRCCRTRSGAKAVVVRRIFGNSPPGDHRAPSRAI
jgi:hypothetical protein